MIKHQLVIKFLSLLIAISFMLPLMTWAFEPGNYGSTSSAPLIHHLEQPLTLPDKLGDIDRVFQGHHQTVIVVQDLHCHDEVQKNIAGIIDHLVNHQGLNLVAVEGASGPIDPGLLRDFPIKSVRRVVSDYLVKQGQLTGADYYAITAADPILLEGIETQALYEESLQTVKSFLTAEIQGLLYDVRSSLDELKPHLYSDALLELDQLKQHYRMGRIDLTSYGNQLAKRAGYTLDLHQPQEQLIQALERLDHHLRSALYTNNMERQLDEHLGRLDIIEKLLNISVTQEELTLFRRQPAKFHPQVFLDFARRTGAEPSTWPLLAPADVNTLSDALAQVAHFYQLADERSRHFVANLIASMQNHDQNLAVMINGGFHTDDVLAALEEKNISYLSVRPRVTRLDVLNPYFELLQKRHTPLEKLLINNQTMLAVANQLQAAASNGLKQLAWGTRLLATASAEGLLSQVGEAVKDFSILQYKGISPPAKGLHAFDIALEHGVNKIIVTSRRHLRVFGFSGPVQQTSDRHYFAVFDDQSALAAAGFKAPNDSLNLAMALVETGLVFFPLLVLRSLGFQTAARKLIQGFVTLHADLTLAAKEELATAMEGWLTKTMPILWCSVFALLSLTAITTTIGPIMTAPQTSAQVMLALLVNPWIVLLVPSHVMLFIQHSRDSYRHADRPGNLGYKQFNIISRWIAGRSKQSSKESRHNLSDNQRPEVQIIINQLRDVHRDWSKLTDALSMVRGLSGRERDGFHNFEHPLYVAYLTNEMGRKLRWTNDDMLLALIAALLHDLDLRPRNTAPQVSKTRKILSLLSQQNEKSNQTVLGDMTDTLMSVVQVQDTAAIEVLNQFNLIGKTDDQTRQQIKQHLVAFTTHLREALAAMSIDVQALDAIILRTDYPWTQQRVQEFEKIMSSIDETKKDRIHEIAEVVAFADKFATSAVYPPNEIDALVVSLINELNLAASLNDPTKVASFNLRFMQGVETDSKFKKYFSQLPEWSQTTWRANEAYYRDSYQKHWLEQELKEDIVVATLIASLSWLVSTLVTSITAGALTMSVLITLPGVMAAALGLVLYILWSHQEYWDFGRNNGQGGIRTYQLSNIRNWDRETWQAVGVILINTMIMFTVFTGTLLLTGQLLDDQTIMFFLYGLAVLSPVHVGINALQGRIKKGVRMTAAPMTENPQARLAHLLLDWIHQNQKMKNSLQADDALLDAIDSYSDDDIRSWFQFSLEDGITRARLIQNNQVHLTIEALNPQQITLVTNPGQTDQTKLIVYRSFLNPHSLHHFYRGLKRLVDALFTNNPAFNQSQPRMTGLGLKKMVQSFSEKFNLGWQDKMQWTVAEQVENVTIATIVVTLSWLVGSLIASLTADALTMSVLITLPGVMAAALGLVLYMLWSHQEHWDFGRNNGQGVIRTYQLSNILNWDQETWQAVGVILINTMIMFAVFTGTMLLTGQLLDAEVIMTFLYGLLILSGAHRLLNQDQAISVSEQPNPATIALERNEPIARYQQGPRSAFFLAVSLSWTRLLMLVLRPVNLLLHLVPGQAAQPASFNYLLAFVLRHFYYSAELQPSGRQDGYLVKLAEAAMAGIDLTDSQKQAVTEVMVLQNSARWQAKLLAYLVSLTIRYHRLQRDQMLSQTGKARFDSRAFVAALPQSAQAQYLIKALDHELAPIVTQLNFGPQHHQVREQALVDLTQVMLNLIDKHYQAEDLAIVQQGLEFFTLLIAAVDVKPQIAAVRRGQPTSGLSASFVCPQAFFQKARHGELGRMIKLLQAVDRGQVWRIKDSLKNRLTPWIKRHLVDVNA